MTVKVIEIVDLGIRVSDDSGEKLRSPGIARLTNGAISFGEEAFKNLRIDPLNCHHQFWQRLSVEPLTKPVSAYRHSADIAYAHLQAIAMQAQIDGDAILVVPSSYTREQLAVLLGLAQHCPFRVIGLTDSALLAASAAAQQHAVIYVDLHLHETVLTKLVRDKGVLSSTQSAQIPASGWLQISESLLQFVNAAFMQQSRFNPQHDAETEQYLFDTLPEWLGNVNATNSGSEAAIESTHGQLVSVMHKGKLHQASLPHSSFVAKLDKVYDKIVEQIQLLSDEEECGVLLSSSMQELPWIAQKLRERGLQVLEPNEQSIAQVALGNAEQLKSEPGGIRLVTSIKTSMPDLAENVRGKNLEPTHALSGYSATQILTKMSLYQNDNGIALAHNGQKPIGNHVGDIVREGNGLYVRANMPELFINGEPISQPVSLSVGDKIGVHGAEDELVLIRVQNE